MLQILLRKLTSLSAWRLRSAMGGLFLVLITLGYILLAIGVHRKDSETVVSSEIHDDDNNNRHTRDLMGQDDRQTMERQKLKYKQNEIMMEGEEEKFLDVMKLRPKMPISMIDPLSKLKNQSPSQRDALAKRMRQVEADRQDVYLKALRKRGQLVSLPDGGDKLVSDSQMPLFLPNVLKHKDSLDQWLPREKVWLNLTHFPWPKDPSCSDLSVRFAPSAMTPVGIVSYPGSGNTLLRFMVEGATGIFTGSMYNDIHLKQKGLYGEGIASNLGLTLGIKSHGATTGPCVFLRKHERLAQGCNHMRELGGRAVLLIRDPFAAIVSHRNLDAGGHQTFAGPEQFQGEGWDEFVKIKIRSWENLYLDWLSEAAPENVLAVHYEDLKPMGEVAKDSLRRVARFLVGQKRENEKLELDRRVECATKHPEERFHRKTKSEEEKGSQGTSTKRPVSLSDPFTQDQIKIILSSVDRVSRALVKVHKQPLPTHLYMHH